MSDDKTRAKMAILSLTPDEIIAAIELLPRPKDWRELAAGSAGYKQDMLRISDAVLTLVGWEPMGGTLDIYVAAYSYKCSPEQARSVAKHMYRTRRKSLVADAYQELEKLFGTRPHNPDTMEMIFDDDEIL